MRSHPVLGLQLVQATLVDPKEPLSQMIEGKRASRTNENLADVAEALAKSNAVQGVRNRLAVYNIEGDYHDGHFAPGFSRGLLYSMRPEVVEEGYQHPRLVWESRWEETFGEPSAFPGFEI
jgi:hypothetical protein